MDCWLRCNRRAVLWGSLLPLLSLLLGAWMVAWRWTEWNFGLILLRICGGVLVVGSSCLLVALLWFLRTPRVAYEHEFLVLNVRLGEPIRVPLEIVECFFLGQGPSQLGTGSVEQAATSNVIVRLAERATEWHRVEVTKSLGQWCDGYVTLHGAWCEPVTAACIQRLNAQLVTAKQKMKPHRQAQESAATMNVSDE